MATPTADPRTRPVAVEPVPLMDPKRVYADWGPGAEEALVRILRDHAYVKGPEVKGLETEFAAYTGTKRAVAVDSGTDAIYLPLRAVLDDRPASAREVIVPSFTFFATAGAVANAGGVPVFADVLEDTMDVDPASVARLASERTAAVVPVHLFGLPADLAGVRRALGARKAFLLEDAAQAVDATVSVKRVGSLADAGAFSFYPSKNLGAAGDGGIFTTNDDALADLVASLREHGSTTKLYHHERVGKNSRMDEMQAAVVRRKLPALPKWTAGRQAVARRYAEALGDVPELVLPRVPAGMTHVYHLYVVRAQRRDALQAALKEKGIGNGVYYPVPLHRQPCFAKFRPAACPVSDRLATEVLALPCFPGLRPDEQDRVVAAIRAFYGR
jgi:dTDP-4-amino-4,6-dideoxygalactose transaminase